MKKVLKIIGIILLALVALVLVFIGILTLTEYKPADEEAVEIAAGNSAQESIRAGDSLRVVTWNIGYGALGDNADFFMDGGKGVRTADLQRVQENMDSMIGGLQKLDPDVIFLQELDIQSDRSHILNYRSSYIIQKRPPLERGHFFYGLKSQKCCQQKTILYFFIQM